MESLEYQIEEFLNIDYGWGHGSGDGYGSESTGYGAGSNSGNGSGFDSGTGSGDGFGSGSCSIYSCGCGNGYDSCSDFIVNDDGEESLGFGSEDLTEFCGHKVYFIDNLLTIIYSIHNNIAKGAILQRDLTLKDCYIAKVGNYFAHGGSAQEAFRYAMNKYQNNLSEEDRLQLFVKEFPNYNEKYKASELFDWHNTLTHSCKLGRESFCRDRGIDINTDQFTIAEFVEITKDSYGGKIINKLKKYYEREN